jgi:hypothetical protein
MKFTSALVLAALFATTNAAKLNSKPITLAELQQDVTVIPVETTTTDFSDFDGESN